MILKAKKKDLGSIVKIHLNVLSQTFNSRIGDKFLYNLYDILLRNPDVARIWVVKKNDKVAGFISVCQDFKKVGKTINKNTKRKYILLLLKFLYVDTERNNLNAILFYKKMGFRPIKEFLGNLILGTKINV